MGNFEEVDLTELVRRILANIAPLAHAADRDLELDSPGKVPAIVSASALEEAVRNLVDNALRHTPPGSTVGVSVRPGATIEVSDRGPGVPLELREQVFEPFWSAARKSEGGAGLGLDNCARGAAAPRRFCGNCGCKGRVAPYDIRIARLVSMTRRSDVIKIVVAAVPGPAFY